MIMINNHNKYIILSFLILIFDISASCQIKDTSIVIKSNREHSPKKAIIYSMIIPGLGQIYNKKYWKVPIIYGAGGTLIYYIGFNQLQYKKFRNAYWNSKLGDTSYSYIDGKSYDYNVLYRGMRYYERNRNISIFGLGLIYILNIIDAMVDAHFYYYDISDDLSINVTPVLIENPRMNTTMGLRINLVF